MRTRKYKAIRAGIKRLRTKKPKALTTRKDFDDDDLMIIGQPKDDK